MNLAVYGLLWEEWRRTRKLCALSVALLAAISLIASTTTSTAAGASQLYSYLSYGLLGGFIIYLTLSQSTKDDIQAGIPRRRFLLPVSNFTLVLWPLLYRLTAISLLATATSAVALGLFDSSNPHLQINCGLLTAASVVNLLAWSARLFGKILTSIGFFMLVPASRWIVLYMYSDWLPQPWQTLSLPVAAAAVTLATATTTVALIRSGGLDGRFSLASMLRPQASANLLSRDSAATVRRARATDDHRPFATALFAQVWYEWRSRGLKMTFLICVPTCAIMLIPLLASQATSVEAVFTYACQLLLVMAIPVGMWSSVKRDVSGRRSIDRFAHTRCVDDWLLTRAKLGEAATTTIISLVVCMLFAAIVCGIFVASGREITTGLTRDSLPVAMRLAVVVPIGAWITYTRGGLVVLAAILFNTFYAVTSMADSDLREILWVTRDAAWPPLGSWLVLAGCMIVCLMPFVRAFRRNLLTNRGATYLLFTWCSGALLATVCLHGTMPAFDDVGRAPFAAWAAGLTLLALTPVALVRCQVDRARHQ